MRFSTEKEESKESKANEQENDLPTVLGFRSHEGVSTIDDKKMIKTFMNWLSVVKGEQLSFLTDLIKDINF